MGQEKALINQANADYFLSWLIGRMESGYMIHKIYNVK
jgi:hypothetical protein